jgi:hypothetical protein
VIGANNRGFNRGMVHGNVLERNRTYPFSPDLITSFERSVLYESVVIHRCDVAGWEQPLTEAA